MKPSAADPASLLLNQARAAEADRLARSLPSTSDANAPPKEQRGADVFLRHVKESPIWDTPQVRTLCTVLAQHDQARAQRNVLDLAPGICLTRRGVTIQGAYLSDHEQVMRAVGEVEEPKLAWANLVAQLERFLACDDVANLATRRLGDEWYSYDARRLLRPICRSGETWRPRFCTAYPVPSAAKLSVNIQAESWKRFDERLQRLTESAKREALEYQRYERLGKEPRAQSKKVAETLQGFSWKYAKRTRTLCDTLGVMSQAIGPRQMYGLPLGYDIYLTKRGFEMEEERALGYVGSADVALQQILQRLDAYAQAPCLSQLPVQPIRERRWQEPWIPVGNPYSTIAGKVVWTAIGFILSPLMLPAMGLSSLMGQLPEGKGEPSRSHATIDTSSTRRYWIRVGRALASGAGLDTR